MPQLWEYHIQFIVTPQPGGDASAHGVGECRQDQEMGGGGADCNRLEGGTRDEDAVKAQHCCLPPPQIGLHSALLTAQLSTVAPGPLLQGPKSGILKFKIGHISSCFHPVSE